jgi:hypothetical protein
MSLPDAETFGARPPIRRLLRTIGDWDDEAIDDLRLWCAGYQSGRDQAGKDEAI